MMSVMNVPTLGENEQICNYLERGTLITKYYQKKRPEKKYLSLRRETRQILVSQLSAASSASSSSSSSSNATSTTTARNNYDFALELREVKEMRFGKHSKDFDKWEESKKVDQQKCFVILYGNEFKLKTFSVVAHSEKECDMWVKGIKYMLADTINSPYPLQVERWLRKEFYGMETTNKA
jgi:phosphatidylinositol phospholipase C gamma-1